MDHHYIDEHSVAQRYIDNALTPEARVAFETHLVDCQECTDRVLLAGMFQARQPDPLPLRVKLAARLKPWQMIAIFAIIILLLVAVPAILIPVWLRLIR